MKTIHPMINATLRIASFVLVSLRIQDCQSA